MTQQKDIERRNKRVEEFFKKLDLKIKLIGKIDNPAIVLNNKTVLSCYVHNFYLRFLNKPHNGALLFEHKLLHNYTLTDQHVDLLLDWLKNKEHRECFSIKIKNSPLRLSGYNFKNKIKGDVNARYPVFSEFGFKLYFDMEHARQIIEMYSKENLKLELV